MQKTYFYRGLFYLMGLLILALGITLNTCQTIGRSSSGTRYQMNLKLVLFMAILQFPLSLIFTRFLNIFSGMIPDLWTTYPDSFAGSFPGRILFLIIAIILTGVGAAMSLNMRIIPNPGDGIVQAISDFIHKSVGFTKNCFDLFNICLTISVGLIFAHHLAGIGIGTVLAVIGVGRAIAAFNHFFKQPMAVLSGMNES